MKIAKVFAAAVFAVLATACATDPMQALKPKPNEPVAYLAGTLAMKIEGDDALTNGSYSLLFRPVGGTDSPMLTYTQSDFFRRPKTAYESSSIKGGTFVLALRPGEYEFHNINFFYSSPLANHTIRAKTDFSVPFTLKAGRVLYVGELLATGVWGKNVLNYVPAGGYFVRTDNVARDKALLEAAHPEIKGLPIDTLPMDKAAPPFLVAK